MIRERIVTPIFWRSWGNSREKS